ncbi:hypothetical protein CLV84_2352 [Neolewinella xylanilytica]|uniref:DUF5916 domain-containing protein n=1 Tax=Neolewinella xylanilytica TaxID=1514080 RepID=A0A2S6I2P0_9BACT|nr:DUF5916 domain-containing protein [Neolewinella xylanilytica]PPK85454.1 hypothetical protein CLV84_2352 [Neolewinella xylanilytica]
MNLFFLSLGLLLGPFLFAQTLTFDEREANRAPEAIAVRFSEGIELDGQLNEIEWLSGAPAKDFWETFPSDTSHSTYPTEIYFGFDDANLYVAAICRTPGKQFIIPSLRRDYRAGGNDNITFVFNPFRDKTNAIVFGMNPYGVSREALIYNGGESSEDFREEWDNKWRGESFIGEDYWSCELVIPLASMRFPAGAAEWFFNSYRMDTQSNTRSTWHRIPQNQTIMSLAYMGSLKFEGGAPAAQGKNLAVIPYAGGGMRRDYQAGTPTDFDGDVGGDAKVGIGSGLNLDLTVNPDFSQVEVDEQVINTTRFEVFFPERRQFFLENADLFGSFGFERANPFFSRRIGVTRDTTTGEGLQNPIYFGARLSGKANDDWRIGLLNMQAAKNTDQGMPSFNYTVAATQRRIGARSNLGGIFVNKQNFSNFSDSTERNADFNRVAGLDFNLATRDNAWNGKTFVHRSFSQLAGGDDYTHGLNLEYRHRNWNVEYDHVYVGQEFNAEVGFVPRRGYFTSGVQAAHITYPKNPGVIQRGPTLEARVFSQPGDGLTDRNFSAGYQWRFANTSRFTTAGGYEYIFLFDDFDPSRTGATPLPGGRGYGYWRAGAEYESDGRKRLSTGLQTEVGEFFNGYGYSLSGNLQYRYQPFGSIDLRFSYQYIDLPSPYASKALFLIGPRIDFTFTKAIFLTTFLQYNDQIDNINVNARLQWRFAPVSDFFLVYTDNYDSLDFGVKNRSIVAKVTYWLNI